MPDWRTTAAETLYRPLDNFHRVEGQQLRQALLFHTESSLSRIILGFKTSSLVIQARAGDDTIDLQAEASIQIDLTGGLDASNNSPWNALIGMEFGWGWLTINQQGYCDGVLLSFQGIRPQVFICVEGSSLKVRAIQDT